MPHIVLAGYLGCGNLGDDAVMLGLVHALGNRFEYTVLAGNPGEIQRLYGMRAVDRRAMRAVDEALDRADALVFPGGSVFQDATSVRSVAYYHQLVKRAKGKGKKVLLVGQGVGPLGTFFGKRLASAAFGMADLIVARDPSSAQLLKALGVKRHIYAGSDSAFLLPAPPVRESEGGYGVGGMRSIAIAPRPFERKGLNLAELFGEFCHQVYAAGAVPTLVEMHPEEDGPLIDAISKQQGGRVPQMRGVSTPTIMQERLARMDGLVAMRLHAGILATTVGVPPLMIAYDPKVTAFARMLDLSAVVPLERLTAARLFEAYTGYVRDAAHLKGRVEARRSELLRGASINADMAHEILLGRSPALL